MSGFPPQEVAVRELRLVERGSLVETRFALVFQRLSLELPIRLILPHAWVD